MGMGMNVTAHRWPATHVPDKLVIVQYNVIPRASESDQHLQGNTGVTTEQHVTT